MTRDNPPPPNVHMPRDVPITPMFQDPEDSQRLWALGLDNDGPVFLTCFRGNQEWHVNWSPGPWSEYGVTVKRVVLWSAMLAHYVAQSSHA